MQQPTISIRNWSKYQHYKQRNPPWIRIYNSLLDEPAFIRLPDHTKFHLVGLFLIASRTENKIPADPSYLQLVLHTEKTPDLKTLQENGWFDDDASKVLAECLQHACSEQSRAEQIVLPESSPPPGEKPPTELCGARSRSTGNGNGTPTPHFEAWWAVYRNGIAPRPLREKHKALAEWKALKAENQGEAMISTLEDQIAYRDEQAQLRNFVPNLPDPIRYLKRKLWREEIP